MIGNLLYKTARFKCSVKKLSYFPQSTWDFLNMSYLTKLSFSFFGEVRKNERNSGSVGDGSTEDICTEESDINSCLIQLPKEEDISFCRDHNLMDKKNNCKESMERNTNKDLSDSLWWYSRASHAGSPLGSIYVGLMNHFGIGVPYNLLRASRYYQYALTQTNGAPQVHS